MGLSLLLRIIFTIQFRGKDISINSSYCELLCEDWTLRSAANCVSFNIWFATVKVSELNILWFGRNRRGPKNCTTLENLFRAEYLALIFSNKILQSCDPARRVYRAHFNFSLGVDFKQNMSNVSQNDLMAEKLVWWSQLMNFG